MRNRRNISEKILQKLEWPENCDNNAKCQKIFRKKHFVLLSGPEYIIFKPLVYNKVHLLSNIF